MRLPIVSSILLIFAIAHASAIDIRKALGLVDELMNEHVIDGIDEVGDGYEPPEFCHKLDCPKYELMQKKKDYELRCYLQYKWATEQFKVNKYGIFELLTAFLRLYRYFQGANEQKKKFNMTVPVALKIELAESKNDTNSYTMLFFVPFEYQKSPPKPAESSVKIVTVEPICVYVRSYDGYPCWKNLKENLAELQKSLKRDKVEDYRDPKEVFYHALYDGPWKRKNRHNEIHLVQKKTQAPKWIWAEKPLVYKRFKA